MTGWRLGWSVWPTQLIEHANKMCVNDHSCPSSISQHAGLEAIKGPKDEVHKIVAEFEKRNTIVIGASCDTPEVHFAWLNTSKDNGGIEGVTYPILADSNRNLSSTLGILDITNETYNEETGVVTVEGDNVTYRATYLIDEEGTVFHEGINHMPVGRNVAEFLRLIDAYTHVQKNGEVCPANWEEGKEAMNANREGVASYLASN